MTISMASAGRSVPARGGRRRPGMAGAWARTSAEQPRARATVPTPPSEERTAERPAAARHERDGGWRLGACGDDEVALRIHVCGVVAAAERHGGTGACAVGALTAEVVGEVGAPSGR